MDVFSKWKQLNIHLMINNNPYNVPEKPLKQSKVIFDPTPLYPHQMNRRHDDIDYKFAPHMLKRSSIPFFLESTMKEMPRIPVNTQTLLKG
jgi:hypothetical protein